MELNWVFSQNAKAHLCRPLKHYLLIVADIWLHFHAQKVDIIYQENAQSRLDAINKAKFLPGGVHKLSVLETFLSFECEDFVLVDLQRLIDKVCRKTRFLL